jgi:hypothetical protein
VPPVVAALPPLDAELLLVAGVLALVELSLLLPPHAASPMASADAQAPARIKRCMRFTGAPLP